MWGTPQAKRILLELLVQAHHVLLHLRYCAANPSSAL